MNTIDISKLTLLTDDEIAAKIAAGANVDDLMREQEEITNERRKLQLKRLALEQQAKAERAAKDSERGLAYKQEADEMKARVADVLETALEVSERLRELVYQLDEHTGLKWFVAAKKAHELGHEVERYHLSRDSVDRIRANTNAATRTLANITADIEQRTVQIR